MGITESKKYSFSAQDPSDSKLRQDHTGRYYSIHAFIVRMLRFTVPSHPKLTFPQMWTQLGVLRSDVNIVAYLRENALPCVRGTARAATLTDRQVPAAALGQERSHLNLPLGFKGNAPRSIFTIARAPLAGTTAR